MSKKKNENMNLDNARFEDIVTDPEIIEMGNDGTNESVTESKPVVGVVTDCSKLNIRREPKVDSQILSEALINSTLSIDLVKSTDEWYSVCTSTGIEGFCMKKFVIIKQ